MGRNFSMPHPSAKGYNRIARYYDDLAGLVFGKGIFDSQYYYFKFIPQGSKVLILGGGTGWVLVELLKVSPTSEIWYIDSSIQMIQLASNKVGDTHQVHFINGTEVEIPAQINFDVVVTNFFLDGFSENELPHLMSTIERNLNSNSIWLAADFIHSNKLQHKFILWIMHLFFRHVANHPNQYLMDWEGALCNGSWRVERNQLFCSGQIKSVLLKQKLN